jgi:hypothetical protein
VLITEEDDTQDRVRNRKKLTMGMGREAEAKYTNQSRRRVI